LSIFFVLISHLPHPLENRSRGFSDCMQPHHLVSQSTIQNLHASACKHSLAIASLVILI